MRVGQGVRRGQMCQNTMSDRGVVHDDQERVDGHAQFLFGDTLQHVEPKEFVDALLFAVESLAHNNDAIAYMRQLACGYKHGRTDAREVADELGCKPVPKRK